MIEYLETYERTFELRRESLIDSESEESKDLLSKTAIDITSKSVIFQTTDVAKDESRKTDAPVSTKLDYVIKQEGVKKSAIFNTNTEKEPLGKLYDIYFYFSEVEKF